MINLRDHLNQSQVEHTGAKCIPTKLLIELIALSQHNFRIELKSKYQTISLPLPIAKVRSNANRLADAGTSNVNAVKTLCMYESADSQSSLADNDDYQSTAGAATAISGMNPASTHATSMAQSASASLSSLKSSTSSLSPLQNEYIISKCYITNENLTLVPPIRIFIPYNYPDVNPFVDCVQLDEFDDDMLPEYSGFFFYFIIFFHLSDTDKYILYASQHYLDTLGILRRVNKQFQINYLRLAEKYSVTQLMEAWVSC